MFRKWIKRFSALAAAAACLCAPAYAAPPGYTQAGHTENVFFYGDQGYQIEYRYDIENKLGIDAGDEFTTHFSLILGKCKNDMLSLNEGGSINERLSF